MIPEDWIDSGAESHVAAMTAPATGPWNPANAEERTHAHELEEQLRWIQELTL